jgi:hypothetical protein
VNKEPSQVPVTVNTATLSSGAYRAVSQIQQKQPALSNTQSGCPLDASKSGNAPTGFCSTNSRNFKGKTIPNDENFEVFVGNVPHYATDFVLKVRIY